MIEITFNDYDLWAEFRAWYLCNTNIHYRLVDFSILRDIRVIHIPVSDWDYIFKKKGKMPRFDQLITKIKTSW